MTPISEFSLVAPGIWRSGHFTEAAQWEYFAGLGGKRAIKLDTLAEDNDSLAAAFGIEVLYHPISTLQQILLGPNDKDFRQAVSEIIPGTIVHCKNGWDRTGLAIGCFRLWQQKWSKNPARAEMDAHGYHEMLLGLTVYWMRQ